VSRPAPRLEGSRLGLFAILMSVSNELDSMTMPADSQPPWQSREGHKICQRLIDYQEPVRQSGRAHGEDKLGDSGGGSLMPDLNFGTGRAQAGRQ
jgi:hypothetical protein